MPKRNTIIPHLCTVYCFQASNQVMQTTLNETMSVINKRGSILVTLRHICVTFVSM